MPSATETLTPPAGRVELQGIGPCPSLCKSVGLTRHNPMEEKSHCCLQSNSSPTFAPATSQMGKWTFNQDSSTWKSSL